MKWSVLAVTNNVTIKCVSLPQQAECCGLIVTNTLSLSAYHLQPLTVRMKWSVLAVTNSVTNSVTIKCVSWPATTGMVKQPVNVVTETFIKHLT